MHLTEFPCSEHKNEIMTYIISYYITMRMRQHIALQNRELKKKVFITTIFSTIIIVK